MVNDDLPYLYDQSFMFYALIRASFGAGASTALASGKVCMQRKYVFWIFGFDNSQGNLR